MRLLPVSSGAKKRVVSICVIFAKNLAASGRKVSVEGLGVKEGGGRKQAKLPDTDELRNLNHSGEGFILLQPARLNPLPKRATWRYLGVAQANFQVSIALLFDCDAIPRC